MFVIGTVSFLKAITIQGTAASRDHGAFVLGFRRSDLCFLPHGAMINAQYCSNLLHYDVHQTVQKKRSGKLSDKIIHLLDTANPHSGTCDGGKILTMGEKSCTTSLTVPT